MSEGRTAVGRAARMGSGAGRLMRAWRVMPHERRLAAYAAIGLFLTMFLPWYQRQYFVVVGGKLAPGSDSQTAWAQFSFVEAAVLLVAFGVLTLLFQRAEGKAFHLPGGDGWVITAAGFWTCTLIVWRIFDKQGGSAHGQNATTYGIEWGIFIALAIAAFLVYAGSRIRASHQPEPPLPGEDGAPGRRPSESRPHDKDQPAATIRRPAPGPRPSESRPDDKDQPAATIRRPTPAPEAPAPPTARRASPTGAAAPRPEPRRERGWLSAPRSEPGGPPAERPAAEPSPSRSARPSPPAWSGESPPEWPARRRPPKPVAADHEPPGNEEPTIRRARSTDQDPARPSPRRADENPTIRATRRADENPTVRAPRGADENPTVRATRRADEDPTVPVAPSTPAARRHRRHPPDDQFTIPLERDD
jgi:hypothetical protein